MENGTFAQDDVTIADGRLVAPDVDHARYLLRELDWGEHFVGTEMNPAAGNRDIYIYSLKEAAQFLRYGTAGMGFSTGSKGTISFLDVNGFISWIEKCVGDTELAVAIAEKTVADDSFHGKIQGLGLLTDLRYTQLLDIVKAEEAEREIEDDLEISSQQ